MEKPKTPSRWFSGNYTHTSFINNNRTNSLLICYHRMEIFLQKNTNKNHIHISFFPQILALNHMKDKFESKSIRAAESRRKLHASKTKLAQIIKTVKKFEREVNRKKNRFQRSVLQLNAAIEEANITQTPNGFSDERDIIGQTQIQVHNAQKEIDQVELELRIEVSFHIRLSTTKQNQNIAKLPKNILLYRT